MIKVIWVNFSGIYTSSKFFQPLWSSGMSLYIGDLKEGEIESPVALCSCGACVSCKANIENIKTCDMDIKDIKLKDAYVDYSVFRSKFYAIFINLIKEKFPDSFDSDSNIALICEEEPNIDVLTKEFLVKLREYGYRFTPGELTKEDSDGFPLQLHEEERARFSHWIEAHTSVASTMSFM